MRCCRAEAMAATKSLDEQNNKKRQSCLEQTKDKRQDVFFAREVSTSVFSFLSFELFFGPSENLKLLTQTRTGKDRAAIPYRFNQVAGINTGAYLQGNARHRPIRATEESAQ